MNKDDPSRDSALLANQPNQPTPTSKLPPVHSRTPQPFSSTKTQCFQHGSVKPCHPLLLNMLRRLLSRQVTHGFENSRLPLAEVRLNVHSKTEVWTRPCRAAALLARCFPEEGIASIEEAWERTQNRRQDRLERCASTTSSATIIAAGKNSVWCLSL